VTFLSFLALYSLSHWRSTFPSVASPSCQVSLSSWQLPTVVVCRTHYAEYLTHALEARFVHLKLRPKVTSFRACLPHSGPNVGGVREFFEAGFCLIQSASALRSQLSDQPYLSVEKAQSRQMPTKAQDASERLLGGDRVNPDAHV
jgi:hypothetical protein